MTATPSAATAEHPFPPDNLPAFLQCCAGEWMSLRSRFDLEAEGADDEWHASERGELVVEALPAADATGLGGLAAMPKQGGQRQELHFLADGQFRREPAADGGAASGHWTLWPDGSLDLVIDQGDRELRERIWFTKPNLRLRSTVEQFTNGSPGRASFSSEIRRVSRPAAS